MPNFSETLKYAFFQSDGVGKAIVIALIIASIWSWTIILNKLVDFILTYRNFKKFLDEYKLTKSPIGMGQRLARLAGPLKEICAAGINELFEICRIRPENHSTFYRHCQLPRQLTDKEIEKIRSIMNSQVDKESATLESDLGILSILVSVSPFLGLFGTVWGVMVTFIAISLQGRPDLSAIAPGISGALLTTVAGLSVAIPALVTHNIYSGILQKRCLEMDNLVNELVASLQLEETAPPPARPLSEAFMAPTPERNAEEG